MELADPDDLYHWPKQNLLHCPVCQGPAFQDDPDDLQNKIVVKTILFATSHVLLVYA